MEEQVDRLVQKAWNLYLSTPPTRRLLIGVAGIPGSGKTTLATIIVRSMNALHQQTTHVHHQAHLSALESPTGGHAMPPGPATMIPMDGYHLTRAQLSALPDPVHAHARRGAPFTFDGEAYLSLLKQLRAPVPTFTASNEPRRLTDDEQEGQTVYAPSFDHAVKDPVENAIAIMPQHRICVIEGNYIALDREPWREARGLLDECWFVRVDEKVAGERLVKRHVEAGIEEDEEQGWRRVNENDMVNGREIMENRLDCEELLESNEDEKWRT